MSVERRYRETLVAGLAAREKQMQQRYRPVISVHKWFARRPGLLFRALALAEQRVGWKARRHVPRRTRRRRRGASMKRSSNAA